MALDPHDSHSAYVAFDDQPELQIAILPYGEVKLNMTRRIALNAAQTAETSSRARGPPHRSPRQGAPSDK